MALCKGSAIYICLIDPKLLGHLFLSISLAHAKMQLNLPSKYFSAIFQSFCPGRNFVKELYSRNIHMSLNFSGSFLGSNNDSPPNLCSCNLSMWAQLQILFFGQIFSLWSNYILYCFNWAETLQGHASTYINSLHQVLAELVNPIALCNFSNFLSRMKLCEASATLVFTNGMKFL